MFLVSICLLLYKLISCILFSIERVYITDVYVDLPSDITAIPQYYTVHCIVTGRLDYATIKHYYDDDSDIELTQSYCTDTHDGYSCTVDSQSITTNYTYSDTGDYTVTVEWEGKTISNGLFRQSQHDGDHVHVCTAASGAIGPIIGKYMNHMLSGRYIEMTVKGITHYFNSIWSLSCQPPVPLLPFLLWSVVLSLVSLSAGHILLVYLMLMCMWLMLAVSMTIG